MGGMEWWGGREGNLELLIPLNPEGGVNSKLHCLSPPALRSYLPANISTRNHKANISL